MSDTLPERRRESDIYELLGRMDEKLDALANLVAGNHARLSDKAEDQEMRLRHIESALPLLATKSDIEDIEAKRVVALEKIETKRIAEQAERSARVARWLALGFTLIVPLEAALIAWLVQQL